MNYRLPRKFPLLPRRKNTDKSDYGHTLILAGSRNMIGAALLSSEAALKSGSGLVTLGMIEDLEEFTDKLSPEIMRLPLERTKSGSLGFLACTKVFKFARKRKITAVALGSGLSQNDETGKLVRKLVRDFWVPVVLDADGLNSFRGRLFLLKHHKQPLVLTPHAREFERLFAQKLPDGEARRIKLAKKLSRFYDVVLVVKGPRTLVISGDTVYKNHTGNPGMAKGGTGDVLTGIIASFISQRLSPFLASVWAVYFHGLAGDLAAKRESELSMTASDIVSLLPRAFKSSLE